MIRLLYISGIVMDQMVEEINDVDSQNQLWLLQLLQLLQSMASVVQAIMSVLLELPQTLPIQTVSISGLVMAQMVERMPHVL